MEKYCPKPHPVYFNAFSMWQQLSGSVQYLIKGYSGMCISLADGIDRYMIFACTCQCCRVSNCVCLNCLLICVNMCVYVRIGMRTKFLAKKTTQFLQIELTLNLAQ